MTMAAPSEHSQSDADQSSREDIPSPGTWARLLSPRACFWWFVVGLTLALFLNIGMGAVEATPRQIVTIVSAHVWKILDDTFLGSPLAAVGSWLMSIGPVSKTIHWVAVDYTRQIDSVVWSIRLPRTLMATFIGAGLAVSGATMQGLFRNPLADPGLIGVSTGASAGAILAIVAGVPASGIWALPIAALTGAALTTTVVYGIARNNGRTEVVTLILAGVAVNAILGAAIGMLMTMATDAQLRSITFWTLGSLGGSRWNQVGVVVTFTVIGIAICLRQATSLNLLSLGEREARHLGIEMEQLRIILIVAAAMMVGSGVAFVGVIGFVGLIVPHFIRLLIGPDHRTLLPLTLIAGATVLLMADLAARTIAQPIEVPIGVIMSLVGGPFFLWLLIRLRSRQGGWG